MLRAVCWLFVVAAVGGTTAPTNGTDDPTAEDGLVLLRSQAATCVAAAVTPDAEFAVTAAHCVYELPNSAMSVLSAKDQNISTTVKRVIVHPYYAPPSLEYDVALVKTNKIQGVKALKVAKVSPGSDASLMVFGWKKENEMTTAEATLEDRKSCRLKLANHIVVSSRMLCANFRNASTVAGSLLLKGDDVVGIGSFYAKGSGDHLPKVFTSTAHSEINSFISKYID